MFSGQQDFTWQLESQLCTKRRYKKFDYMVNYEIINNEKNLQFEIHEDDEMGVLQYRFYKNDIALMHTEVPEKLGGKGIAAALAKYAFRWAEEHNKKVMVYCPYVAAYVKKHPELNALVDKNYQ